MVLENGKAAENLWQLNILSFSQWWRWIMGYSIWPGPEFPTTFHTPGPAVGSPPHAVMSFTCAGWIWAAVPILDKLGDNTPASTFFFFFFTSSLSIVISYHSHCQKKKKKITVFEHFSRGTLERRPRAYRGCVLLLAYLPVLIFSLLSDCGFSFPSSSFQKRKFLLLLHFFSLTFDISLEYLGISGIFLFSFFWLHANSVYTWIFFFFFFLERGSIHFPQTFLGLLNPKILRTTDLK